MLKIINARVLTQDGFENRAVYVKDGKFTFCGDESCEIIDAKGNMLIPGFTDIHIHGACGYDFNDGNAEGIDVMSEFLASHGTTSVLATTSTADKYMLKKAVEVVAQKIKDGTTGTKILGLHMEGPFFSTLALGAQNPAFTQEATLENLDFILGDNADILKLIAVSPELENAEKFVSELNSRGVVTAIGHTGADYDCAVKAIKNGCKMLTHFYNAMTPLKHRDPGVVGAVLEGRNADIQLICDFVHVHPAAIKIAINCVGKDHVAMISDAISGTGLGDGQYMLGGLDIFVKNGVARIEGGALAGSTLTLDVAMKNMVSIGYSVEEVSRFLSYNPLKMVGLADSKGLIKEGYDADAVIMDSDFNVKTTFVDGKIVYKCKE